MSGDLQEQIQAMQQRVVQLQRQIGESSSPQPQEIMAAGLQELSTALEQLQVANTARQQQQLERQQGERRLQLALDALNCIIYDWDVESCTVDRTLGLLQVLGYHPHEAEPTLEWWTGRIHPDERERVRQSVNNALTNSQYFAVEYRIRDKSDRYRYVWDKGQIIRNASGEAVRVVGSTIDISERKAVENALKETTERFQTVITNAPIALFALDSDGVFTFSDGKGLERLGIKPNQSVGHSVFELYRNYPDVLECIRRVLTGTEETWIFQQGDLVYESRATSLRNENNQVIGVIGVSTDITERQRAQAALRESEQRLQAILDNSPAAVYIKDLQGRYLKVNRQCERQARQTREQIIGKSDYELFDRAIADKLRSNDQDVLASQTPLVSEEELHLDDGVHTVISVKFPLFDEKGVPYGVCGISTDITERKQAEQALQQLNEELEERVRQRTESLQQLNEQLQNEIAEHQQTLNALRLSEQRFRRAIVHAPIPIMIHAEDGEIIQINQVWTDITGYTHSDIPTIADWTQHAYGEAHEAVKAWIDQLYNRDRSIDEGEIAVTTRNGETRTWDFCSAPLGQLPDGKRLVISMARDITERKRAETALQESERRLSELATNIPGAIYQFVRHSDGSYSFPYMSPGSHRVFELEASEIEDNSAIVINRIHPDDRQSFDDSVIASAETLEAWHWEGRFIMPSGELKWLRGASCPKQQANGDVVWDGLLMNITDCKNTEFALQESELRFRQLADNISQVFWVATGDFSQILYINPAYERVWGRTQASLYEQPMSWLDTVHPDDRDRVVAILNNERNQSRTGEYRIIHPDGSVRWIRFYTLPILNQAGEIYRFAGIAEDISDVYEELRLRQQAEETIRRREQEFRAVVENAPDIIARYDRQLRHLYVNPALEQATGMPRAGFIGKTNRELGMPEPNILLWEPVIQRIFETGIEDRCEFTYITPNGLRHYQARYVPEFTADGTVESVLEISRDITEIKQAEETIRRREQEFRALVENAPDIITRFDRQLRHLYVNPAAERVSGILCEAFIGKTNRQLGMPEPTVSNRERILQRIFETGTEDVFEFSFVTPRGLRHYQSRYVPEFAADGTVESVLGICRDITELKQAEAALAESEQRFRTSIENMLDCFGIYTSIRDESGKITDFRTEYLNAAACESNQVTKEEVIGKGLGELLPNHRESGLFDEYVQVVETGQPLLKEDLIYEDVYGEERLIRAFDIRIVKLNDGFVATWRDITQRKLADEALRQSEEHLRLVVQNMPVMLDAWDTNRNLIAWNRECERVTGYTTAEIVGNPRAFEILYPDTDYRERMIAQWQEEGSDYRDWEWTLTSNDGQLKTIAWYNISQSFPIQGWHGWAIGVDITERKRAEAALRESEQRFRQLAENIREVFWLVSLDYSQRIYISSAYEEIWGRTCQSWYEKSLSWLEGVHPDDRNRVIASLEKKKLEKYDHEYRIVRLDGTIRWIRDRSFPVRDEQGRIYRIAGIAEDITSRKLAEAEMEKALEQERELNELKSNFIAIASHQFRTPLTTISSSAELLERYRHRFSEEKQLTHLSRIQTAVGQMTQLLDDVLLVGKAGAGKLEFNPTPIDVVQFCEDLVEELQLSNKNQHGITFAHQGNCKKAVEGTTDLLPLLDEKYLRHIFDNLLSNAIKYSPNGGTVRFELTCFCDRAVFQVQDEGIGIPPEDLPHLFDSFHRATNVGSIQGTGLGLAIVKQCVDLQGGQISVESQVGCGTTFIVTLPLNYPHQSNNPSLYI